MATHLDRHPSSPNGFILVLLSVGSVEMFHRHRADQLLAGSMIRAHEPSRDRRFGNSQKRLLLNFIESAQLTGMTPNNCPSNTTGLLTLALRGVVFYPMLIGTSSEPSENVGPWD